MCSALTVDAPGSQTYITSSSFVNNSGVSSAAAVDHLDGELHMTDCTVEDNNANVSQSSVHLSTDHSVSLTRVALQRNSGGPAMAFTRTGSLSSVVLEDVVVRNNSGGGLSCTSGDPLNFTGSSALCDNTPNIACSEACVGLVTVNGRTPTCSSTGCLGMCVPRGLG